MTVSSSSADRCTNGGSSQRRSARIVSPESCADKAPDVSGDSCSGWGSEVEVCHHCHGTPPPSPPRWGSNAIGSQRWVSGVTFPAGREAEKRLYAPEQPEQDEEDEEDEEEERYLSLGLRPGGQDPAAVAPVPKQTLQPIGPAQLAGLPPEGGGAPPLPPLFPPLVGAGRRRLVSSGGAVPAEPERCAGDPKTTTGTFTGKASVACAALTCFESPPLWTWRSLCSTARPRRVPSSSPASSPPPPLPIPVASSDSCSRSFCDCPGWETSTKERTQSCFSASSIPLSCPPRPSEDGWLGAPRCGI